jgi:hypothetical protein
MEQRAVKFNCRLADALLTPLSRHSQNRQATGEKPLPQR